MHECDLEAMPELEGEYEGEYESFWNRLKSAGVQAARGILRIVGGPGGRPLVGPVAPFRDPQPAPRDCSVLPPDECGGPCGYFGTGTCRVEGERCVCKGSTQESESEFESDLGLGRHLYTDALMEHLGHAAAYAHSEAEAEALIGALVPLAARRVPRGAPAILRAAPSLIRGAAGVARTLRRDPMTRPIVRTIPTIVRRTAAGIAQQVNRGQAISPQKAARNLARQTVEVLCVPQQTAKVYRRARALDRQYHRGI